MCKELYVIELDRDKVLSKDSKGRNLYSVDGLSNVTIAADDLATLHKINENDIYETGLEEGYTEAWDLGRKLVCGQREEGLDERDMVKMFGTTNIIRIFRQYTPKDISKKLTEYALAVGV